MKKLFTLLFIALGTMSANAQLQFVDKDGKVIADGSTITASTAEDDGLGGIKIDSGVFIKNTVNSDAGVGIRYTIETIDNGSFQICFPLTCDMKETTGSFATPAGTLGALTQKSMQCEWIPMADGVCKVTIQIENFSISGPAYNPKYNSIGLGDKITIDFNYNSTAIKSLNASTNNIEAIYDLNGKRLQQLKRGLNIIRMSDGKVMKRMVK